MLDEGKRAGHQRHRRHQPEGRAGRQRVALLLADADADARQPHHRRRAVRGDRRELDGPRVRHQLPRARAAGLGLAVDPARRWPRADALPAAPRRWLARSAIERHAGGSRRPHDPPRRGARSRWRRTDGAFTSTSGRHLPRRMDGHRARAPGSCFDGLHAAREPGAGHARRRHRLLGRPGGRRRHVARRLDRADAATSR